MSTGSPLDGSMSCPGRPGSGEGCRKIIGISPSECEKVRTLLMIVFTEFSANLVYVAFPVSSLSRPNSRVNVPASAMFVTSTRGLLVEKSSRLFGIQLPDLQAWMSLLARMVDWLRRMGSFRLFSSYADSMPPRYLMVVSKTLGCVVSKEWEG